jgi:hypothetical protein
MELIFVLVLLTANGWQETQARYANMRECLVTSSAVTLMPTLCMERRTQ